MGEAKRRQALAGEGAVAPMAWHHTDLVRLVFIINDRQLEASRLNPRGGAPVTGQRVVWFTDDRQGDPLAAGTSMQQRLGVPAVRIGVPLESTLPAGEGCQRAGWTSAKIEEDARRGQEKGAQPASWRVLIADALPMQRFAHVEVRHAGSWQPLEPDRLDAQFFDKRDGSGRVLWLIRGYGVDLFVEPSIGLAGERSYEVTSAKGAPVDPAPARLP